MRPNLPFLSAASNAILKLGGLLRWNKRLVKDARLLLPLTEVMKIARLTSPLLDVPCQSLPRPRLRHGRRLALLFHLNLILNLHSLLRSIAGSPSSSSSSPNFPNCSSPRESASVYAAYLRSHFPVSQPKALRSRARGYLTELAEPHALWSLTRPFVLPSLPLKFSPAPYPMLKHLPRSGMGFLLHIFNLSWSSHSFPSIWKTSSIIPIYKVGKPLDSLASFRSISLTSYVSKLFERIILSRVLFFLESNSILSLPARPVSALDGLHSIKFCTFLSPFRMGLTNPGRALGRCCLLSISLKLLTLSGIPPFFTNLFRLASLLALLVGLNLSFLIGALVWSIKITKAVPFESVEVFCKDPFLALHLYLSSLMIFRLLCLLPSAALFTLTIWPFGPPPVWSLLRWRPHKKLCFDWSAGVSTGVFLSI